MTENAPQEIPVVDASRFQTQLHALAEVLAQKLKREAPQKLGATPDYVSVDLHVLMRVAMGIYNLMFYLNADERRKSDYDWRPEYSVSAFPLVRNLIDCLYNITIILENPRQYGELFRRSGFKYVLDSLDEDEAKHGDEQRWRMWIHEKRKDILTNIRACGLEEFSIRSEKWKWLTLGKYLINAGKPGVVLTPHQQFLWEFTHGPWSEYSAMAHGTFDGLLPYGAIYAKDSFPHDDRGKLRDYTEINISSHIARAALILITIITEVQLYFRFDGSGANIDERLHEIWNELMPLFEAKELYTKRYDHLLREAGIRPGRKRNIVVPPPG